MALEFVDSVDGIVAGPCGDGYVLCRDTRAEDRRDAALGAGHIIVVVPLARARTLEASIAFKRLLNRAGFKTISDRDVILEASRRGLGQALTGWMSVRDTVEDGSRVRMPRTPEQTSAINAVLDAVRGAALPDNAEAMGIADGCYGIYTVKADRPAGIYWVNVPKGRQGKLKEIAGDFSYTRAAWSVSAVHEDALRALLDAAVAPKPAAKSKKAEPDLTPVAPVTIEVVGDTILIGFPKERRDIMDLVRDLPGASFDPGRLRWTVLFRWRAKVAAFLQSVRDLNAAAEAAAQRKRDEAGTVIQALRDDPLPRGAILSTAVGSKGILLEPAAGHGRADWLVDNLSAFGAKLDLTRLNTGWDRKVLLPLTTDLVALRARLGELAAALAEAERKRQEEAEEADRKHRDERAAARRRQAEAERAAGIVRLTRVSHSRGDYAIGGILWIDDQPHRIQERKAFRIDESAPSLYGSDFLGNEGGWGVHVAAKRLNETEAAPLIAERAAALEAKRRDKQARGLIAKWQHLCSGISAMEKSGVEKSGLQAHLSALTWRSVGAWSQINQHEVALDRTLGLFWYNQVHTYDWPVEWNNWSGGLASCAGAAPEDLDAIEAALNAVDGRMTEREEAVLAAIYAEEAAREH